MSEFDDMDSISKGTLLSSELEESRLPGGFSAYEGRFPVITAIGDALEAGIPYADIQWPDNPMEHPIVTQRQQAVGTESIGRGLSKLGFRGTALEGSGMTLKINPEIADTISTLSDMLPSKMLSGLAMGGIIKAAKTYSKLTHGDIFVPEYGEVSESILKKLRGSQAVTEDGSPMVMFRFTRNKGGGLQAGSSRSLRGPREMGMHIGTRTSVDDIEEKAREKYEEALYFEEKVSEIMGNPMLTPKEKREMALPMMKELAKNEDYGVSLPILVDIKNPVELPDLGYFDARLVSMHLVDRASSGRAKIRGKDITRLREIANEHQDILDSIPNDIDTKRLEKLTDNLNAGFNREIQDILKENGYDGVVYKNTSEGWGDKSFIAFDDEQIYYLDEWQRDIPTKEIPNFKGGEDIQMQMRDGKMLPEVGVFQDEAGNFFEVMDDGTIQKIDIESIEY